VSASSSGAPGLVPGAFEPPLPGAVVVVVGPLVGVDEPDPGALVAVVDDADAPGAGCGFVESAAMAGARARSPARLAATASRGR
jgi:hypothetical protein